MAEEHAELVQRCLVGDPAALRRFVDMFQQSVFVLCYRMLRHRQDAEDVAQESLVRAVRYLKSWDSSQPLSPWILKIAANRCRTALGQRARRPIVMESAPDQPVYGETDRLGIAEELQQGLDTLNENHRMSFILFYQQDLSVNEISAVMDVPPGTIKTWLHRSRKQLAEYLTERGISPKLPTHRTSPE